MVQPTPGFIPPALPLVPVAANGIVSTGGLLGAAVAGAAAGAKAGAILGPKGALAGAVVGAVVLPLLLPQPTAPGTLPGLDPGLNDPEPTPEPELAPRPDTPPTPIPVPPGKEGQVVLWEITYKRNETRPGSRWCPGINGGSEIQPPDPTYTSPAKTVSFSAEQISIELVQGYIWTSCGEGGRVENEVIRLLLIHLTGGTYDGQTASRESANRIRSFGDSTDDPGIRFWVDIVGITADGEPVPNPFPPTVEPVVPKPRPIPLTPLPGPQPEPSQVPIPEPGPQPQPLEVPSPDNPTAPPITPPQAPPAPPQEVPGPGEQPGTTPITPTPVPPPLPVPGVPTIPEPTPDPQIAPAPGPAPIPAPIPGPNPEPNPDPLPGTSPSPSPIPLPAPSPSPQPGPITTPQPLPGTQPTDPVVGVKPKPTPPPVTTPPDTHFPVPGGPGVNPGGTRPAVEAIAKEVGRIEQKVARLQRGQDGIDIGEILRILGTLADLLEFPYDGTEYTLQGVCEEVVEGEPQPIVRYPAASAKTFQAIINRLDAMAPLFQQHLAWRTPTCKGVPPQGEWRTIGFISDEISDGGKRRINRRFRYRSLGLGSLDSLIDYWKDFTFIGGPVIVKHLDAWWGTPQVWAASGDEGKRVIRHAAREAGIDPDQVGRWQVSGVSNPRYGMPCTLRVNQKGGYWWITARDGPSERPLVGTT